MRRGLVLGGVCAALLAAPLVAHGLTAYINERPIDLDGMLEVREVIEADRSAARDRTRELLRLRGTAEISDAVRAAAALAGRNGGPSFRATKSGTYNLTDVFQDVNPSVEVEELYVDFDLYPVDLRIGKQKLHWGKLDRSQPNDLFNPYQFNDSLLDEQAENKIGIPAVRVGAALPERSWLPQEGRLALAWAPMYVPFRFSEPGERWFPPAATPVDVFHIPAGLVDIPGQGPIPALDIPVGFATRNAPPPPPSLKNSSLNLRFSGFAAGVDFAVYYYHGFDTQPAFRLLAEATAAPAPETALGLALGAETTLEPVFRHVEAWGADAAYTLGPVTLRAEGAFVRGRPFTRDLRALITDPAQLADQLAHALAEFQGGQSRVPIDLGASFVERDAAEWGIGADYTWNGWLALCQLNQTDVFDNRLPLLIEDVETRFLVNLRKDFWRDRVHAQLIGVHALESDYSLLLPRVTIDLTDTVAVRAGYLAIAGRRTSLLGQYKDNDQGFVHLRLSF